MPDFDLLPHDVIRTGGVGPEVELVRQVGKSLRITLNIDRMRERQTLELEIYGSEDGIHWQGRPIMVLPKKYYCGTYHHVVDLSMHPDVHFLRIQYRLKGWEHRDTAPCASLQVQAEVMEEEVAAMAAV